MVLWIESARALLDMPRIVSTALNLHKTTGFFKLDAVVFGSDDYCADIGEYVDLTAHLPALAILTDKRASNGHGLLQNDESFSSYFVVGVEQ